MTRGNIVIIYTKRDETPGITASVQFNGDMYPEGKGGAAISALLKVQTVEDYVSAVKKFDDTYFKYADEDGEEGLFYQWANLNFADDYYARYNSDYIYVKNISSRPYTIIEKNGFERTICPGEIQTYCFGMFEQSEEAQSEAHGDELKAVLEELKKAEKTVKKDMENYWSLQHKAAALAAERRRM